MQELRHPISRALYGIDSERNGLVRVEDKGRVAWFTYRGEWREGDRFDVDPELCVWVGGPSVASDSTKPWKQL